MKIDSSWNMIYGHTWGKKHETTHIQTKNVCWAPDPRVGHFWRRANADTTHVKGEVANEVEILNDSLSNDPMRLFFNIFLVQIAKWSILGILMVHWYFLQQLIVQSKK